MMEKTLVLLKPDCYERRLMGEVIARFERKGLVIEQMKLFTFTEDLAKKHYREHVEKPFFPELLEYITSGPAVAMVVSGPEAISAVRAMVGPTNGLKAPAGTIRGDFSTSAMTNLVHASDSPESAEREINLYFPPAPLS